MILRTTVGVYLSQKEDADLIAELETYPKGQQAGRMRELARKGLLWEANAAVTTEDVK